MDDSASQDTPVDDDRADPLLRALAAAPSISLGDPPLPAETEVGQSYVLHRVIGAGAMGVVYEATDRVLSRRVAIKVHEIGRSDRAARLWREARAMARLSHPNVVTVHEVGVDGSRGYIAMELVVGTNARKWCAAAARTWPEIVDVYRQAGEGLAVAHDVGIVHRDFKPDNVLIGEDGRARVADFGLALEPEPRLDEVVETLRDGALTRTGAAMGTPAYMAPEQLRGGKVDARSDQFAFCVSLFEALHGVRPDVDGVLPVSSARPGPHPSAVPAWIDAVLLRGLAVDPGARHPDMRALVRALDPSPRRRRRVAIAALAGVLVGGALLLRLGGVLGVGRSPCEDAGAAIDETWSSTRADELRAAFDARNPAIAEVTATTAIPALDDFGARWRDEAREACEATRVRGEQSTERLDQRMDCLGRARQRFGAVVDLLGSGATDAMTQADALTASLPNPGTCARPDVAHAGELDGARRALYDDLSLEVDRIWAEILAGRIAESKETLDVLLPRIEAAGLRELFSGAWVMRGRALISIGRTSEAVVDFTTGTALAIRSGDREEMTYAMTELAVAVGRTSAGYEEAMRWIASVRELGDELQWSPKKRSGLMTAELEILTHTERYAEMERVARAILDADQEPPGARVVVLSLLAVALERQGRAEDALAVHDEALALAESVLGPQHPTTAMVLGNRAALLRELGRAEESRASLERVLAIRIASYGPDAPLVGEVYRQLGDFDAAAGDVDSAVRNFDRAIAIHRAAGEDALLVYDLGNLASLRSSIGENEEAARLMDEAMPLAERAFGADSVRVAEVIAATAPSRIATGKHQLAATELERALAISERLLPSDSPLFADVRAYLAHAYAMLGRVDEALGQYELARQVVERTQPPESADRIEAAALFGEILERAGKTEESLAQRREAAALADRILADHHPDRVDAWRTLGRQLVGLRRRDEALDVLERAQELDAAAPADAERTAEIEDLMGRAQALPRR